MVALLVFESSPSWSFSSRPKDYLLLLRCWVARWMRIMISRSWWIMKFLWPWPWSTLSFVRSVYCECLLTRYLKFSYIHTLFFKSNEMFLALLSFLIFWTKCYQRRDDPLINSNLVVKVVSVIPIYWWWVSTIEWWSPSLSWNWSITTAGVIPLAWNTMHKWNSRTKLTCKKTNNVIYCNHVSSHRSFKST